MLEQFIQTQIRQELPFRPNEGQTELLGKLALFITAQAEQPAFLLRGYAGTGKTSVVAALVRALDRLRQPFCLLAPTGRAAKVLAAYSGFPAYTIHRRIYRQKQLGADTFVLSINTRPNTLFIVDEASMLANQSTEGAAFGSGRLLDDLIRFVYSTPGCSLLLLGDDAQLPPVGCSESPALSADYLARYGLSITEHTLTEVARQALDSGILFNATGIRQALNEGQLDSVPAIQTDTFTDIRSLYDQESFLSHLEAAYREAGPENTLLITRSNYRANAYNQGVRSQILWHDNQIATGDRIMVTKNNYFWTEQYDNLPFLANGDMFEVVRLSNERERYGFQFIDASLKAVDYDWEIDVTLWLDSLYTPTPEANYALQKQLFSLVAADYPEIRNRRDLVQQVMKSPYYNALQIRFAYAVTCHKAQGGQWKHVFIDPEYKPEQSADPDFYRWLYTALTRAQESVFLIAYPPAVEK